MSINKTSPTTCTPIIDCHVHLGAFRNFHIPENNIHGVISAMDAFGIDAAIIAAHAGISADYRFGNDQVMDAARLYPSRVLGYCCINPAFPSEATDELQRCFDNPAFRGIKLHPELHDNYPLYGPGYGPMWDFAAERQIPVLIHSYFGGDSLFTFGRMADTHPKVPIILGHAGLDFGLDGVISFAIDHPNVWLDLCGALSWEGVVESLVEALGARRLLFGTDLPFINGASQMGCLVYARLPAADIEAILGRNAFGLFKLENLLPALSPDPIAGPTAVVN
jgi:uncharacterized protein